MLKLVKVKINKYKSFVKEQEIRIDDRITTLVGKNESGKTAFLEALAKINYFEKDNQFKLNTVLDYPRNELNKFLNSNADCEAVRCTFEIDDELLKNIENEIGKDVFTVRTFSYAISFRGKTTWFDLKVDEAKFLAQFLQKYEMNDRLRLQLERVTTIKELLEEWKEKKADDTLTRIVNDLNKEIISKSYKWDNKIKGFIAKHYLKPAIPKFWYFDEYYLLPSRININLLKDNATEDDSIRISKAFFELAKINIDELLEAEDYESYLASIESTANEVTGEIFKYWSTDRDLEIKFEIDNRKEENAKILDIRIRNSRRKVTLPLKNRSKGLNMFFSFIVWFSKIQSKTDRNFILLLDEPGLNLHSSAQNDILRFIEDISADYQIIYSTHSPFMINPHQLQRVRTVSDTGMGSQVKEINEETDSETLFPLKAAIGFNMMEKLVSTSKNLLVDKPSDLLYLNLMSKILKSLNYKYINEEISILPVGNINKFAAFVSLLGTENPKYVCLIQEGNDKEDINALLTKQNVITCCKLEDLFDKSDFLKLVNSAYDIIEPITENIIGASVKSIENQIEKEIGSEVDSFIIANKLATLHPDDDFFTEATINNFENLFEEINSHFYL
jgi:predicted ATP-dependent endonuclease of OLD family